MIKEEFIQWRNTGTPRRNADDIATPKIGAAANNKSHSIQASPAALIEKDATNQDLTKQQKFKLLTPLWFYNNQDQGQAFYNLMCQIGETPSTDKKHREGGRSSQKKKQQQLEEKKDKLNKLLLDKLGITDIRDIILKKSNSMDGNYEHSRAQSDSPQQVLKVHRNVNHHHQNFRITMFNDQGVESLENEKLLKYLYLLRLGPDCMNELLQNITQKHTFVGNYAQNNWGRNVELEAIETLESIKEVTDFQSLYKVKNLLGSGAFGVVLLVQNKHTGQESALKLINKTRLSVEAQEFLKKIKADLSNLCVRTLNSQNQGEDSSQGSPSTDECTPQENYGHKGIVKFKQMFDTPIFSIIEMEYVNGGLLKRLFKRSKPLSENEVRSIVKNLLEGVGYIHERGYIHRDLKPENILMCQHSSNYNLKIVDFGLSVQHKGGPISLHQQIDDKVGTLIYMAPEQATYQSYSKKVDIWSIGIIMYQLMSQGKHPLYKKGEDTYYEYLSKLKAITKEQSSETNPYLQWKFASNFTDLAKDFFSKLCAYPPSERYDTKMALQHPWITGEGDISLTRKQKLRLFNNAIELKKVFRSVLFCAVVVDKNEISRTSPIDRDYFRRVMEYSHGSDSSY